MTVDRRALLIYLLKFLGLFCLLFYGTEGVIAFSSPGHYYSPVVAGSLNFIDPFRHFLLQSARGLLSLFGMPTYFKDPLTISVAGGRGIRMVYSCLGYGVLSFWTAFVWANRGSLRRKIGWTLGGSLALIAVNIGRISLVLVAANRGWSFPFGWDHHLWFTVVAYLLIGVLVAVFDRTGKPPAVKKVDRRVGNAADPVLN